MLLRRNASISRLVVAGCAAVVFALVGTTLAVVGPDDTLVSPPQDRFGAGRVARRVQSTTTTVTTTTTTTTTTTVPPPATAVTAGPATTKPPRSTVPPPPIPSGAPLAVRNGRFVVDGEERALVGVNASGAASALMLGSPCGHPDVDLDLLFASLPDRALVRVWFTQRMVTNIVTLERNWYPIDAVVEAAERSGKRPLLLATLATGSGDCDGGGWRDRAWYDGGYAAGDPGMPNSYAGWVDEVVTRYANRDVVAVWEPVNEPDPSTCHAGYRGSGCFGHTTCEAGAAEALAGFLTAVGGRIKAIDAGALVSNGGGGWCGWYSKAERLIIERAANTDIISVHDYHIDDQPVPHWMIETFERSALVNKPLLVGEVGIGAGPNGGGRSYAERADLLAAKMQEQISGGADAVLLWVYGGFDDCGYCIGPNDPTLERMAAVALR